MQALRQGRVVLLLHHPREERLRSAAPGAPFGGLLGELLGEWFGKLAEPRGARRAGAAHQDAPRAHSAAAGGDGALPAP